MQTSMFFSPTMFAFERGAAKSIGEYFKSFGSSKVLVVYDKGVKAAGIAEQIIGYLKKAGLETLEYDNVQADPPDWSVNECGQMAIDNQVDGILGLGGGSSMDTAKAAAILQAGDPPISNYFVRPEEPPKPLKRPMKPLILMPTTAGTGSEVSPGGIITEVKTGIKHAVNCATNLALVDPELTLGLPPFVTATTGFDALCHAVEALTSRTPNAAARVLGLEAVGLISENLEEAVNNGSNIEAREAMSLAASIAIMSIIGPMCHIPHDMGTAIGASLHIPHGAACSFSLAEGLRHVGAAVPDRMREIAVAMRQEAPDGATPEEITEIVATAVEGLARRANMPRITDYVKSREEYIGLADFIIKTQSFVFSPVAVTKDDVIKILGNSYDNCLK